MTQGWSKYKTMIIGLVGIIFILALILYTIIVVPAFISAANPPLNPEYNQYISIRDRSSCTQACDKAMGVPHD